MKRPVYQVDENGNYTQTLFTIGALNKKAFEWFGKKCARCGLENAPRNNYVVHHRHYRTFGNESQEDVALLCKPCHKNIHTRAKSFCLNETDIPFVEPEWADKLRGR